jgi:DNA replication protein DnaC
LLQHPTIDRLRELGLEGMAKSLRDLTANPESKALDHMEWLGILLEHEMTLRQQKRFEARARTAKLRHLASVEDINTEWPAHASPYLTHHKGAFALRLARQQNPSAISTHIEP